MEDEKKPGGKRDVIDGATDAQIVASAESGEEKTSAEILRERRQAAMGGPNVDNEIHRSLPLARVAYALIALTVLAYAVSRLGVYLGNDMLEMTASIATTLLFITTFIVWFVSRHQAKKLTEIKYAEQREAVREAAEARSAKAKAEKQAKKAARRKRRSGK